MKTVMHIEPDEKGRAYICVNGQTVIVERKKHGQPGGGHAGDDSQAGREAEGNRQQMTVK